MVDKKSNVSIKSYFQGKNEKKLLPDPTNDFSIIPSWNKEFACLIGLEEVVQFRLERLDKTVYTARNTHRTGGRLKRFPIPARVPVTLPKDPYTCAKCNTDVSCSWKHDMNSSRLCYSCFKCSWRKDHWHSIETIIKSISDNPSILSSSQPLWNEPQSMKEDVFPLQNSSLSVPQDCDQQVPKNSLSSSANFHPDSLFYSSSPLSSDLSSSLPEHSSNTSSCWSSSFSSDHNFSYIYHSSSSCDSSLYDCSSPTYLPSSSDLDSSSSMSSSPSDFPPTDPSKQVSQKVKMPYWMETPLAKALLKDDKGEQKMKKKKAEQSRTNKSQSKKEKTGKMAALSLPSSSPSNQQILPDTKSALPVSGPSLAPLLSVSKHHFQTQMLTPNLQKKTTAEKNKQTMEECRVRVGLKPGHGNLKKVTPNVSGGYVSCTTSGKSKSTVHSLPTSWSVVSGNIPQQDLRSGCLDDKKESIKKRERFGTKMQHLVSHAHPSSLMTSAPTHMSFLSQSALSTNQGKLKPQEKVKWGAAPNQKIDKWIQKPKTSMGSHGSYPSCTSSSSSVWSTRETEPASSGVAEDENLHYKVQVNS